MAVGTEARMTRISRRGLSPNVRFSDLSCVLWRLGLGHVCELKAGWLAGWLRLRESFRNRLSPSAAAAEQVQKVAAWHLHVSCSCSVSPAVCSTINAKLPSKKRCIPVYRSIAGPLQSPASWSSRHVTTSLRIIYNCHPSTHLLPCVCWPRSCCFLSCSSAPLPFHYRL